MSDNVFLQCQASSGSENATELLECVSNQFQNDMEAKTTDLNDFLLILAGAMIFFMQSGFAMLCAGSVRLKNVQNTMLKNLLDACGAALAFYVIGEYKILEEYIAIVLSMIFSTSRNVVHLMNRLCICVWWTGRINFNYFYRDHGFCFCWTFC